MSEDGFHDYDFDYESTLYEGIEGALAKLTPQELAALSKNDFEMLSSSIAAAVEAAVSGYVPILVAALEKDAPGMLEDRRGFQQAAELAIAEHWQEAFDRYRIVLKCVTEIGEFYFEKHQPKNCEPADLVFLALGRMVARACRIAEQVLVLLRPAMARAHLHNGAHCMSSTSFRALSRQTLRSLPSGSSRMKASRAGVGWRSSRSTLTPFTRTATQPGSTDVLVRSVRACETGRV